MLGRGSSRSGLRFSCLGRTDEPDHTLYCRSTLSLSLPSLLSSLRSGAGRVLVSDVLDEEQHQHIILVLAGVYATAQFVSALPERAVEFRLLEGHPVNLMSSRQPWAVAPPGLRHLLGRQIIDSAVCLVRSAGQERRTYSPAGAASSIGKALFLHQAPLRKVARLEAIGEDQRQ